MAWSSIKELVGAVPVTERSERAEIVALPNKGIARLYEAIIRMRGEIATIDGQIGARLQEWEEYERQLQDAIQRLQSDKDRAMRELRERQDDWRKVTADLGIVVQWDDAVEVENDRTIAD